MHPVLSWLVCVFLCCCCLTRRIAKLAGRQESSAQGVNIPETWEGVSYPSRDRVKIPPPCDFPGAARKTRQNPNGPGPLVKSRSIDVPRSSCSKGFRNDDGIATL